MDEEGRTAASINAQSDDFDVLQAVIRSLKALGPDSQRRVLEAVETFLGIGGPRSELPGISSISTRRPSFSQDNSMSVKEFLLEKQPRSDVERVAALAYYLTHYQDQPHFKTLDLSKLNIEAAQPKFSNAANSVNNAVKRGYLASATKGQRQLSAAGEQFVLALPDREAARTAMANLRPRRRVRRSRTAPSQPEVS